MVLIENCFCCSLAIAAGFLAVYLLITYLIAFAFELLWILEASVLLPTPAILLCAGYFALALFAALLIHGLATKNTLCLISWMFAVTVLTFPEAGMVIYMSIQYWRIESLYGVTELACWFARILANVIEIIIVQSLYAAWKEEELVAKRLRDLSLQAVTIPRDTSLNQLNSQYYQNNGYQSSVEQLNVIGLKRASSTPQIWGGNVPNNYPFDSYQFCTTQSEFNASVFMPKFINDANATDQAKKAQSLMDLRGLDEKTLTSQYQPWISQSHAPSVMPPQYTLSLGRKAATKLPKFASLEDLNEVKEDGHMIRNRTGFYAQPIESFGVPIYYGPLDGPDFLIYKKQIDKLSSKNSLSNTSADDVQKYRDVAL